MKIDISFIPAMFANTIEPLNQPVNNSNICEEHMQDKKKMKNELRMNEFFSKQQEISMKKKLIHSCDIVSIMIVNKS